MITNVELTQIKERAEKATPGPWKSHADGTVFLEHTQDIADVWTNNEDAEFIAHAREDVPRLVAEVERLQELCNRLASARNRNARECKALYQALSSACSSLGADISDYYDEEALNE